MLLRGAPRDEKDEVLREKRKFVARRAAIKTSGPETAAAQRENFVLIASITFLKSMVRSQVPFARPVLLQFGVFLLL